jgi:hypothetical protein
MFRNLERCLQRPRARELQAGSPPKLPALEDNVSYSDEPRRRTDNPQVHRERARVDKGGQRCLSVANASLVHAYLRDPGSAGLRLDATREDAAQLGGNAIHVYRYCDGSATRRGLFRGSQISEWPGMP